MTRIIANLSGKDISEVEKIVSKLEDLSGLPSEDVRHLAETTQALRRKLIELNLDPDDTTGEELYHALLARYDNDARRVDGVLGVNEDSPISERIAKAAELVDHSVEAQEIWCLKTSIAKRLIKNNPPKKLMKHLHYRSVDSLLKREDISAIFIGADIEESLTWHKKLESALGKLGSEAYELRPGRIVRYDYSETEQSQAILVNGIMGAVAVGPSLKSGTPVLTIALFLIDALESLNEDSLGHRLHSAHPILGWWIDTERLAMPTNAGPVSLNFKDVALNHHSEMDYDSRINAGAQHEFWKGLMNRYKAYVDQLPNELATLENELGDHLRPQRELVPEPIEVEV